jgi:hypothetical protein
MSARTTGSERPTPKTGALDHNGPPSARDVSAGAAFSKPPNSDLLLIYLKASSWFTPSVRVMTSSDEKPDQDKDAAKTKLSHSTEIRPPPVSLANFWEASVALAASRACQVPSLCKYAGAKPGLGCGPEHSEE